VGCYYPPKRNQMTTANRIVTPIPSAIFNMAGIVPPAERRTREA
jgi:hypothetical protein